jgi:Na+-driven multidrug efflux pump
MKDLTKGPVAVHVLQFAAFIALTTLFQTLYFLVDLYFVGQLGKEAIAGVGLAGNVMMVVLALTQALGVGATSLIAQAMGANDRHRADLIFNQAFVLSVALPVSRSAWSLSSCAASTCTRLRPMRPPRPGRSAIWPGSFPRWRCSSPPSPWAPCCVASAT